MKSHFLDTKILQSLAWKSPKNKIENSNKTTIKQNKTTVKFTIKPCNICCFTALFEIIKTFHIYQISIMQILKFMCMINVVANSGLYQARSAKSVTNFQQACLGTAAIIKSISYSITCCGWLIWSLYWKNDKGKIIIDLTVTNFLSRFIFFIFVCSVLFFSFYLKSLINIEPCKKI